MLLCHLCSTKVHFYVSLITNTHTAARASKEFVLVFRFAATRCGMATVQLVCMTFRANGGLRQRGCKGYNGSARRVGERAGSGCFANQIKLALYFIESFNI